MKKIPFYIIIISIFCISCNPKKKTNPELDKSDIIEKVLVGAIRWDAWNGGEVTRQVERTLGPEKYHSRLPWFSEVINDSTVVIDGSPQEVMDKEIVFASEAGIDYWAFLLYPESESMSEALQQYLNSNLRQKINFCLILHNAFNVSDEQWPKERDRAVALLGEPGYQTVLDGRPLVFAFMSSYKGKYPTERFTDFLQSTRDKNIDPYCVFMGWNPTNDYKIAFPRGFEAVSAYACSSADTTYAQLCQRVEDSHWQNAATGKVPYIPLITTGWEKNPRKDNPVSWEVEANYHQQNIFPSLATPDEIALHLDRGLNFIKENPEICVANTVIIYAWNEYDEGGWLSPTWVPEGLPDTDRLSAVGKILTERIQAKNK
jgi:hypothetical protein